MVQKSNKIKEPEKTRQEVPERSVKAEIGSFSRVLRYILGGHFFRKSSLRFFRYLLFLTFLAFIYIANNYYAEARVRRINKLRKEVKELRYEYINIKTELMDIEKQSQLEKKLAKKGIKKNSEPVLTIDVK